MRRRIYGVLVVAVLSIWAGCRRALPEERSLVPPDLIQSEAVPPIALGAQGTVHGFIRIGIGFIANGRFLDEHGADRQGLMAGLWMYVRGDPSKDGVFKVHAGQRVSIAGYKFFVQEIQGGKNAFVQLRVLAPHPDPATKSRG